MNKEIQPRVTQQDIADRAGVSRSTVCMALKDARGIPEKTKERIRRIADEMRYSQDPMLSALAQYRSRQRATSCVGTLAWLVNTRCDFEWKRNRRLGAYYEGAREIARKYGFQCEVFDLNGEGITLSRLASIFLARSISGILLCPHPKPHLLLDFPWEDFPAVTFGYTLEAPPLHTVVAAHYRSMRRIMEELSCRGYRRVGLVVGEEHNSRSDGNYMAAYLADCHIKENLTPIPVLAEFWDKDAGAIELWMGRYHPDAIIVSGDHVLKKIKSLGIKVPEELGVVCFCQVLSEINPELASMVENPVHMGEVAVDFLVGMIHRREKGIPSQQQRLLLEGHWNEGNTLPHR
jgi:DNA-binding LacI/PurR family transcriptional regulator